MLLMHSDWLLALLAEGVRLNLFHVVTTLLSFSGTLLLTLMPGIEERIPKVPVHYLPSGTHCRMHYLLYILSFHCSRITEPAYELELPTQRTRENAC